ncbi:hypothetical protein AK88_00030 [Plasmodium fragile]|uniref:NOT2/NOT3/NOT5 C-terminal domain-containing protein n=1 Tax=Plasmodium fragile TaxID=5857 RepID=A0A0D9QTJ7_PLAFR|nr:uncharacterized protein AK88_00030 [Plasmodium fragile]KJP90182.1 hypothetical protein AK88_00030 [Plasmodium fragile]
MGRGNKEKGKNPIKLAKKKKKKNAGGSSKGEDNEMVNSETNDQGSDVMDDNNAPSEGEDPTRMLITASPSELQRGGEKIYNEGEADQKNPFSDVLDEAQNGNLLSANPKENKMSEKGGDHFKDKNESCYATGRDEMGTKVKCSNGTPHCDDVEKRNENRGWEETQMKCVRQGTDGSITQGGGDSSHKRHTEVKRSVPEEGQKNEEEPNTIQINVDNGIGVKGKKCVQRCEASVKANLTKGNNVGDPPPGVDHPEEAKLCSQGTNCATASADPTSGSSPSRGDYMYERGNNDHAEEGQPIEYRTKMSQATRIIGNRSMDPSNEQKSNVYRCSTAPGGEDANIHLANEENIPLDELLYETSERAKKYNRMKYGLMGILKVIKMTDPQLNMLALGTDLTTLGLNLNSPDFLFASFTSPISDDPTYNEDYFVKPSSYLNTRFQIRLSLLLKLQTETLFYIFYNLPKDVLQAYAASELYLRKWMYHLNYKKWFFPRDLLLNQGNLTTCRSWVYFDPVTWTKKLYNDFLNVKEMMHVQDITKCIEHIIQAQANYSTNVATTSNCGNQNQDASSQGG